METLLVNRVGQTREYYLAPIDQCYRLAGLIRLHWKGLSGGNEVWQHIAQFFAELRGEGHPHKERCLPELSFRIEGAEALTYAAVPISRSSCASAVLPKLRRAHHRPALSGTNRSCETALLRRRSKAGSTICMASRHGGRKPFGPCTG